MYMLCVISYLYIKKGQGIMDILITEKHNRLDFSIDCIKYVINWIDERYDTDNDKATEYELDILNKAVEIIKLHVKENINYKEE